MTTTPQTSPRTSPRPRQLGDDAVEAAETLAENALSKAHDEAPSDPANTSASNKATLEGYENAATIAAEVAVAVPSSTHTADPILTSSAVSSRQSRSEVAAPAALIVGEATAIEVPTTPQLLSTSGDRLPRRSPRLKAIDQTPRLSEILSAIVEADRRSVSEDLEEIDASIAASVSALARANSPTTPPTSASDVTSPRQSRSVKTPRRQIFSSTGLSSVFLSQPITTRAAKAKARQQKKSSQEPTKAKGSNKRRRSRSPVKMSKKECLDLFGSDDSDAVEGEPDDDDEEGGKGNDDDFDVDEEESDDDFERVPAKPAKQRSSKPTKSKATQSASKSRKSTPTAEPSVVEESEEEVSVRVPAPETFHKDWKSWEVYLDQYARGTHQQIACIETRPVKARINQLESSESWKRGKTVPLPPVEMETWKRRYACTHGGSQRESRGTGIRPRRFVRFTGCPYHFTVEAVPVGGAVSGNKSPEWQLEVRLGMYVHNHPVGVETYRTYPSERGVAGISTSAAVDTMIAARTKRSEIYDYLLKNGENLNKRDVDNMIAQHRTKVSTADDNDSVAALIAEFVAEDPFNMVSIDDTERGHTGVISFTTALMRATYSRFPEIVLVDCTHKTNRYNYQLCTFMVVDEHGVGQPVQHSLLETNSDWHMLCAIGHFKRAHPQCVDELNVVMVDKDLNEIRVLRGEFPTATVLLCTFHVKKYLAAVSRKSEFGRLSSEDHLTLDHHLHYCTYAVDASDYADRRESLKNFCERVGFNGFYTYFMRNWDSCQPMWVEYFRHKLPYFRVNTNNHLESFFGKVKDRISCEISMTECFEQLLAKERIRANEHRYMTSRVGTNVNTNFKDRELQTVLRFTTHYVADNIAKEYAKAKSKATTYSYSERGETNVVEVTSATHTHKLDLSSWACSCAFSVNMKLPCRHSVSYRLSQSILPLIPLEAIHMRWSRVVKNIPRVLPFAYNTFQSTHGAKRSPPKSRHGRYREAMRVLQPLCSEIAEISVEEEFEACLKFIEAQWLNVRKGVRRVVTAPDDNKDEPTQDAGDGDGDEDIPPTQTALAPPSQLLSQPNSLYSEEIGKVEIAETHTISLPEPKAVLPEHPLPPRATDSATSTTLTADYYDDPVPSRDARVAICLNERVSAVGRPHVDQATVASAVKQDRIRFNAVQNLRRAHGEITLAHLLDTLDKARPGLVDLNKQLLSVSERHRDLIGCRPQYFKQSAPDTVADVFYHLPEPLLKKCFAAFPLSNDMDDAISIASSSQTTNGSQGNGGEVEVVKIRKLVFTRADIETMGRAYNLKTSMENNQTLVRWLRVEVAARVPADLQASVKRVADHVEAMYPLRVLKGFRDDYHYGMLWRFKPPYWFNDAIIRAFLERLADQYPFFQGTHVQRSSAASSMKADREFSARVRDDVLRLLGDSSIRVIALPVCFGGGNGSHWACIMIDKATSSAVMYDSMNGEQVHNTLRIFTNAIFSYTTAVDPSITIHDSPAQFDGHSCGFYVCLKIWCVLDERIRTCYPELGDFSLRFMLLDYILNGSSV